MKPFSPTLFTLVNPRLAGGALALLLALGGGGAQASSLFTVTTLADSGGGSLRAAITNANANTRPTIVFAPKLSGTISLAGPEPTITSSMTITCSSAIALDGGGAGRIFQVTAGTVAISGLTLQNGRAAGGSGGALLQTGGALSLTGCTLSGSSADFGGAIANSGGSLTLTGCLLTGNSATYNGGGVYSQSTLTLVNCVLRGDSAQYGGALDNEGGFLTLTNDTLTGSSAQFGGGLFNGSNGSTEITNSILYGDTASNSGPEVYNNGGSVGVSYSDIHQAVGGTSFTDDGPSPTTVLNADPQFSGPPSDLHLKATSPAAGVGTVNAPSFSPTDYDGFPRNNPPSLGAFEFELPSFVTNTNDSGPGSLRAAIVYANNQPAAIGYTIISFAPSVHGTITLVSALPNVMGDIMIQGPGASTLTIDGASAYRIFNIAAGVLFIYNLTLQNGLAPDNGGAVNANGTLNSGVYLSACTLRNNRAPNGSGGALAGGAGGNFIGMSGCRFYGNSAQFGGAIAESATNTIFSMYAYYSLFVGNTASVSGGAVAINTGGDLSLLGCTLTANSAPSGGAVADSGSAGLRDDILYGDTGGEIVGSGTIMATFSDIAQPSGVHSGDSNLNADPLFARVPVLGSTPPDYGDLHLQNGSPALFSGSDTYNNTTDLDGFTRNNPPSIGAYEFPVGGVTLLTVTNTADSVTQSLSGSLRATLQAAANQSNVIVQFAPGVTGVIQLQGSLPTLVSGLTIHGPGAGSLVVDGGGKYRLFHVSAPGAPTSISGLTLQNGSDKADLGGGGAVAVDSGSALTLTACALRGNRAAYLGGAIYNQGALMVLGSVFSGNSAGSQGGGVYNGSAATLVGDTFSGGSAPSGGGVSNTGTATLTDDILYGDTGGELANFNTVTVTYSDVGQGTTAYPGTGNLNSDPLFMRAPNTGLVPPDYGDLHLRLGSPAAFAGTVVSGNAKDIAGLLRPATPSLGAYDQSLVRVLYNRADGTASIATFHGSLLYARADYGPYPGWTARALAEGPNGSPRLLWNNTDGRVALWNLSDPNPGATAFYYGSYPGWAAVALAVGPDSAAHLLWDNTDGRLALWNTTDPNPGATAFYYGPYPGWSGTAISFGPDNHERLLWDNTSGQVAVWNLSDANPPATAVMAGPYNGWMAKTLTVSADNAAHLLWDNVSGQVVVWNLSDPNPPVSALVAGPYSGWLGQDLNAAPDGTLRLLWDNVSGSTSLWNLNDPNPVATYQLFAPLGTSIAVSLATGP